LVVAKESENIKPGDAELKSKGVKHASVQICFIWCHSTGMNISRDIITQSVLGLAIFSSKFQLERG
jgi:hypothetical protein